MLSNRNLKPIVIELFIRGKKLNTSVAFITQPYFAVLRNRYEILEMNISNKCELQEIVFNHSST